MTDFDVESPRSTPIVPVGPHAVFRSLADAEAFQQAISVASGYPERGVYAAAIAAAEGGPVHRFDTGRSPPRMKPDEGWTWVHALVRRHPDGRRFAFPPGTLTFASLLA